MPIDPNKVRRTVGQRVARRRRERALSQVRLAQRAGLSERYVQMIEAGTENLTLDTLTKLANALEVDPRWLVGLGR